MRPLVQTCRSLTSTGAYPACAPSCSCSSPRCSAFHNQSCRLLHCRPGKSPTPGPSTRTLPTGEAGRSAAGVEGGVWLVGDEKHKKVSAVFTEHIEFSLIHFFVIKG